MNIAGSMSMVADSW